MGINEIIWYIVFCFSGLGIGIFFGVMFRKNTHRKKDGTVLIEPSAEEDKDVIRLIFDIELDDIKSKKELVFGVDNRTGQS